MKKIFHKGACHAEVDSQNNRMPEQKVSRKFQWISGILLLFFTACPTPPKPPARVTPLSSPLPTPAPEDSTLSAEQIEAARVLIAVGPGEPLITTTVVETNQVNPVVTTLPPASTSSAAIIPAKPTERTNAPVAVAPPKAIPTEDLHDVEPSPETPLSNNVVPKAPQKQVQTSFAPASRTGLIPLNDWLQTQPTFKLRQAAPEIYQVITPEALLSFTLGSRFAKLNGVNLGLGYAPMVRNGTLCLHALDLQKNVVPLLTAEPFISGKKRTVVIDPGHGGENYGTKSPGSKLYEKDFTLDWALRIQRAMAGSHWRVVLTRTNDTHVDLLNRVAIADAVQADLFISLHFNAAPGTKHGPESGVETYCLTPTGLPSNIVREFEDDPTMVFPNNVHDIENLLYATRIQKSLVKVTGRRDRGVRRARFMTVLREQKRPAVLVEGGFLSNPAEAQLINNPWFRQQLALAISKSLVQ